MTDSEPSSDADLRGNGVERVLQLLGFEQQKLNEWQNPAGTVTVVVTAFGVFVGWNDIGWPHPSCPCRQLRDVIHVPNEDAVNKRYLSELTNEAQRKQDAARIECRYCHERVVPGHSHDAQTCQGCANRFLSVVY